MLILTRRTGEKVMIGDAITMTVLGSKAIRCVSASMLRRMFRFTGRKSTSASSANSQSWRTREHRGCGTASAGTGAPRIHVVQGVPVYGSRDRRADDADGQSGPHDPDIGNATLCGLAGGTMIALSLCAVFTIKPYLTTVLPECRPPNYLDRHCRQVAERLYACPERPRIPTWGPRR